MIVSFKCCTSMKVTAKRFCSVAPIQFNQPQYVVSEDANEVRICLSTVAGILQRSVSINLLTVGDSAEGLCEVTWIVSV